MCMRMVSPVFILARKKRESHNIAVRLRRSTIGVHPNVSEAPFLRSFISHPTADFSKTSHCIPMNNLMAQVYKNVFGRNKIGIPRSRSPVIQKTFYRKWATSIVKRASCLLSIVAFKTPSLSGLDDTSRLNVTVIFPIVAETPPNVAEL